MTLAQTETVLEAGKALADAQTLGQFQQAAILLLLILLVVTVAYHLRERKATAKTHEEEVAAKDAELKELRDRGLSTLQTIRDKHEKVLEERRQEHRVDMERVFKAIERLGDKGEAS